MNCEMAILIKDTACVNQWLSNSVKTTRSHRKLINEFFTFYKQTALPAVLPLGAM